MIKSAIKKHLIFFSFFMPLLTTGCSLINNSNNSNQTDDTSDDDKPVDKKTKIKQEAISKLKQLEEMMKISQEADDNSKDLSKDRKEAYIKFLKDWFDKFNDQLKEIYKLIKELVSEEHISLKSLYQVNNLTTLINDEKKREMREKITKLLKELEEMLIFTPVTNDNSKDISKEENDQNISWDWLKKVSNKLESIKKMIQKLVLEELKS